MNRDTVSAFCQALGPTTYVCQWGGADVWKIGNKVFLIGDVQKDGRYAFSVKVSAIAFEILKDAEGCLPAPYLASRGMTWIMAYCEGGLPPEQLRDLISDSYEMIAAALPKKTKLALGLSA